MVLPGFPGAVRNVKSISKYGHLIMRFQQWGCKNRPFYHIVVDKVKPNMLFSLLSHAQQHLLFSVNRSDQKTDGLCGASRHL